VAEEDTKAVPFHQPEIPALSLIFGVWSQAAALAALGSRTRALKERLRSCNMPSQPPTFAAKEHPVNPMALSTRRRSSLGALALAHENAFTQQQPQQQQEAVEDAQPPASATPALPQPEHQEVLGDLQQQMVEEMQQAQEEERVLQQQRLERERHQVEMAAAAAKAEEEMQMAVQREAQQTAAQQAAAQQAAEQEAEQEAAAEAEAEAEAKAASFAAEEAAAAKRRADEEEAEKAELLSHQVEMEAAMDAAIEAQAEVEATAGPLPAWQGDGSRLSVGSFTSDDELEFEDADTWDENLHPIVPAAGDILARSRSRPAPGSPKKSSPRKASKAQPSPRIKLGAARDPDKPNATLGRRERLRKHGL